MPRDIPVGNQTSDDDPDSPCLLVNFRTDYRYGNDVDLFYCESRRESKDIYDCY